MALIEVKVPDIGDFKDVAVIELLVKEGDAVKAEQGLVTVESDKASMEIPSSHAGVVKELKIKLGDKVNEGSVLLVLEGSSAAKAAPSPQPSPASAGEGAKAARRRRLRRAMPAGRTSSAMCSCSGPGRAGTRRRSARRTSA